ncbi:MAG: T9SS type A sorting domain-containing protein [Flavobacteriales bacterium]|nr:T9SS type A sorting domain-containing protein [Flavobacteriales bacterium]MBK9626154.1 T9SS type A sorting domain-containing protein [Flavobacteriales bacterium]
MRVRSLVLILAPTILVGQDFRLFNAAGGYVFASTDVLPTTFSITYDSLTVVGSDTIIHIGKNFNGSDNSDELCPFWGQVCYHMSLPSVFGRSITHGSSGEYVFHNNNGADLLFDAQLPEGDTMTMYQDADQRFLLTRTGTDQLAVLGQIDSVRHFELIHQDLSGSPIGSPLNGVDISIGKELGLITFFAVDSFPIVLQPLVLLGMTSPPLGFHQITNEMVFDHQPGDEIQTHFWNYYYFAPLPPWLQPYNYYSTRTILSRQETADSLIYDVQYERFDFGGTTSVVAYQSIAYHKQTVIAEIPFDRFNGTSQGLNKADHCGVAFWEYYASPSNSLVFCAYDNCWGAYDTQGPPIVEFEHTVLGLGSFNAYAQLISPDNGFDRGHQIVYFKKNGISCGNEITVSIAEGIGDPHLLVAPNPTKGILSIGADLPIEQVRIVDLQGRLILSTSMQTANGMLDLVAFPDGMYVLHVEFLGGGRAAEKVLIQH